ncbi:maleylpyruvate isomerase family mycothiol-dependent enzyme [Mycolicibacterium hodleri]|uniref:Maleylpyruvate isomerase family mycothiol-dependent enzyme n=1 Tax=Mycolicibacterium hodleri TaxID=49897 RepID=A0A502EJB8_9MYCO|nr:maleylpyruvate isomerase family mycothiol-dependent enzyme [Mycolicibacterium hodleri]TPG37214.1 maleylpyruvate isomerase family mycothiol-dependent enzyme [Mycolicibacterium hodleri]
MNRLDLARQEREEFADFLSGLTPEQWECPSLCAGWSVRDVVAHCVSFEGLSPRELVARFAKGRLQTDRINGLAIASLADRSPDQLIRILRANSEPRGLGAGFGGRIALTDNMIHHQDIRRPLGLARSIPLERLRLAMDFVRYAPTIRGAWRVRGVRLTATDLDWSHGKGSEMRGTGEALLMIMAGRPDALPDLDGPGVATVASRVR